MAEVGFLTSMLRRFHRAKRNVILTCLSTPATQYRLLELAERQLSSFTTQNKAKKERYADAVQALRQLVNGESERLTYREALRLADALYPLGIQSSELEELVENSDLPVEMVRGDVVTMLTTKREITEQMKNFTFKLAQRGGDRVNADYLSSAYLGLLEAVERFDFTAVEGKPDKEVQTVFMNYVSLWANKRVNSERRLNSSQISLPTTGRFIPVVRAIENLTEKHNVSPADLSDSAIIDYLVFQTGLPEKTVRTGVHVYQTQYDLKKSVNAVSTNKDGEEFENPDYTMTETRTPEEEAVLKDLAQKVMDVAGTIFGPEKQVEGFVRYVLGDIDKETLQQQYDLTPYHVSRAKRKIQKCLGNEYFDLS